MRAANGDQYEGHWFDDKKQGPGRFFYMSTRKMYEGEWLDDVAKCGVFSSIPTEFLGVGLALARASEDHFKLPEVRGPRCIDNSAATMSCLCVCVSVGLCVVCVCVRLCVCVTSLSLARHGMATLHCASCDASRGTRSHP